MINVYGTAMQVRFKRRAHHFVKRIAWWNSSTPPRVVQNISIHTATTHS